MMAVAAAQKNREMFAIKKSYSIEVRAVHNMRVINLKPLFECLNRYLLKIHRL